MMKTVHSLTLMALAATTLASSAVVMNITVDAAGGYLQNGLPPIGENSLASRAFYQDATGGTDNNPESNLDFLVKVLGNWNSTHIVDLPTAPTLALSVDSIGGGGSSYNAVAGYDYVVFHFGGGQAGGGNDPTETGWWSAWYLGKAAYSFTAVPQEGDPLQNIGGFSSARYFNGRPTPPDDDPPDDDPPEVPDGGTTIASLGIALLGLGGLRRLIKKD